MTKQLVFLRAERLRCTAHLPLLAIAALALASAAHAQYAFAPSADHDENHIHYFGTAKDDKGKLISDVTFLLESERASFVFVTEADGRFRGTLPNQIPTASVAPTCSKAGVQVVRVTKRSSPKSSAKESVQVDCVLRRAAAT